MAWLDDRIWCHPKVADLTNAGFRAYVNSIAYSSGFDTKGLLTHGQQRQIGSDAKTRRELITAALWDDVDGKTVRVHDWHEHNGKRDEKRRQDRERKRRQREREANQSRVTARDNNRDGLRDRRALTGDRVTGDGVTEEQAHPEVVTQPATERPQDSTHIANLIDQSLRSAGGAAA